MGAMNLWEVPCVDAVGRPRVMRVTVTSIGHISIHVPAGEVAIVSPDRIEQIRSALDRAQMAAIHGPT